LRISSYLTCVFSYFIEYSQFYIDKFFFCLRLAIASFYLYMIFLRFKGCDFSWLIIPSWRAGVVGMAGVMAGAGGWILGGRVRVWRAGEFWAGGYGCGAGVFCFLFFVSIPLYIGILRPKNLQKLVVKPFYLLQKNCVFTSKNISIVYCIINRAFFISKQFATFLLRNFSTILRTLSIS